MFKNKKQAGLRARVIGQEVNKSPVVKAPTLNPKLQPTTEEAAPNAKN